MRRIVTICAMAGMLLAANAASGNTVASSTMYFRGALVDDESGGLTGVLRMLDEDALDIGDGISGYDIYGEEGATAHFNPGGDQAIGTDHDAWPTWNPDTPDWYQYSLNLYVDGGQQKWAVRNHPGATQANPWYDEAFWGAGGKPPCGVPMSGMMDWTAMLAMETDIGAYITGTPLNPNWAAANGGGAGAWDMDWSWGSEVVPLELAGFKVSVQDIGGGEYDVTLAPAPVRNVNTNECFTTIQAAIDDTDTLDGHTIEIAAGTYSLAGTINVNKAVTVEGAGSSATIFEVSGTGYRFSITAAGATLQDLQIKKTDQAGEQNIIYIGASNVTIKNNLIWGQYVLGDGDTTRAMEIAGGLSGLLIEGNTIHNLRQPAYVNKPTGTIKDNYVYATRGWVISDGSSMTFTGNSWGSGSDANAVDIAIIVDSPSTPPPGFYSDIVGMRLANNNARIDDQRNPAYIKYVNVVSGSDTTGTGRVDAPYKTIGKGITEIVAGGGVAVAAGTYPENVAIGKANLKLQSESKWGAVIQPTTTASGWPSAAVLITADGVTVDGFEIDGTTLAKNGIFGLDTSGLTIKNNKIHGAVNAWDGCGILLMSWGNRGTVYDNLIQDNLIYDTGRMGIMVMDHGASDYTVTSGNTISGNTVHDVWNVTWGDHGGAIQINVAKDCSITNNVVYDVQNGQRGIYMFGSAAGNTITYNTITNNPIGIQLWISGEGGDVIDWGVETPTSPQVHHNNICGNSSYGAISSNIQGTPMVMDAINNWWGDASGPDHSPGEGDKVSDNVDYTPWLTAPVGDDLLWLDVVDNRVYLQHGKTVTINMDVQNLLQLVYGCQAFLNFSSTYFLSDEADVVVAAGGGGVWDQLIWSQVSATVAGDLDVAVGVHIEPTPLGGTIADGTVAKFTLEVDPDAPDGTTHMAFRPDRLNNPPGEQDTMLSRELVDIAPATLNSQIIVIDNTDPAIGSLTAVQDQGAGDVNVLNCANPTLQGTVEISVDASDALAGLEAEPVVTVTQGTSSLTVNYVNEDPAGTFNYTVNIEYDTDNDTWNIEATATDKADNTKSVTGWLCVNKNQVTGTVSMDTLLTGADKDYAFDRDVVFKATNGVPTVVADWTVSVHFVNDIGTGIASGAYTLTDVPADTVALSAKTAWSLRRRVTGLDMSADYGQETANFTGDEKLLGGDLNDSNFINIRDYSILATNYGVNSQPVADINGNGPVNITDYNILAANYFKAGDDE